MAQTITFQGKGLTIIGDSVKPGMSAPDFEVVSADLKPVKLSDFKGKTKLISTFPSLDTPVCDLQVKEFNKHAASFSADVVVIGISKDLPFAIKRFCSENGIKSEVVLSDYMTSSFGMNYGLLIKELNLLARSVQIIDKGDIVRYRQVVRELTMPPDYDEALKALKGLL
ncbi:MAG: thiol peroxidase [Candidatus Omnitrophica bacterium]|nr:thiol peroxidase [Candidatus Omnitrophota bacterium]MBU1038037.1 thiol peroxidase [Candidatus Omnitrophota bacterium]MBU1808376.1 thiol peroxidase [Candidatus Omnitrophota bacterium]